MKMFLEDGFANVTPEELQTGLFIGGPTKSDSIETQLKLISKLNDLSKLSSL